MKRNRRSFLKAVLGCGVAVVVPGALLSEKKFVNTVTTVPNVFTYWSWYKPGIWAMPKDAAKLVPGAIIVRDLGDVVHIRMED